MQYAFKTSQQQQSLDNLLSVWHEADGIDVFATGWLFDHFYPLFSEEDGDCFEAWTLAAAIAARTERLRIGHMVTSNTYRHPAVVANMIATVDHIARGRLDFGFGAGWFEPEHEAYGIPLPPLTERFDRFEEALEVIDLLLTKPVADFDGRYYLLRGAYCQPKPVQQPRPPFVIGGRGEKRLLPAAARWADHYNYPRDDLEDFAYRVEVLREACAVIGRDPGEIETSIQVRVHDIPEAVDKAAAAADAGADQVIFMLLPPADAAVLEPLAEALRA